MTETDGDEKVVSPAGANLNAPHRESGCNIYQHPYHHKDLSSFNYIGRIIRNLIKNRP